MFLVQSLIKNLKPLKLSKEKIRFYHRIKDLHDSYEAHLNKDIEICGWIRTIRKQKDYNFMHLNDGSDSRNIQIIIANNYFKDKENLLKDMNFGTSIKAKGKLVKSTHPQQEFELIVNDFKIITKCDPDQYPFQMKRSYNYEFLRQYPHLRSNLTIFASVLRARNHVNYLIHKYFQANNLIHIHTPIITQNNCEGGCDVFEVNNMKVASEKQEYYFLEPAYLTASAQLHLETLTNSLGNVYTISPTFRAEKSNTRHHLAEFYMIEAELISMDKLENLLEFVENFLKFICLNIYNEASVHDLEYLFNYENKNKKVNLFEEHSNLIKNLMSKKFIRLSYDDALKITNENKKLKKLNYGDDLGKEHEKYLIDYFNRVPVFIINYPKSLKPFYMKTNETNKNLVDNFDLLVHNVGELVGGSLRESNYDVLMENMKNKNMNINAYKFYLETKQFGGMQMGGFGVGLERLIQYIFNIENIRDTCAFPRYWNYCKM